MSRIKKFSIQNLFGYQDVDLSFKNDVMILMGENGLGKTSILNSLYFTLTEKWNKLEKINFEKISITIDESSFQFTSTQLKWYLEHKKTHKPIRYRNLKAELKNTIDINEINQFIDVNLTDKTDRHKIIYEYLRKNSLTRKIDAPIGLCIEIVDAFLREPDLSDFENLLSFFNEKDNKLNILYFPTYRRVEEELHNLGKLRKVTREDYPWHDEDEVVEEENLEDETLIQFGMEDVELRISKLISKINETSIKGFAKVTGEMLHQLQEGFPTLSSGEILKINSNNIEIILNRVKNNLSEADRKNILNLLDTKELLHKQELAYFLIKLEDIYIQQRHFDNAIKNFANVCNEYLVGKILFFDESSVTLKILNIRTNEEVFLNQLSSGEKQIVSLFSKLYLEENDNHIIFFDEPELSLSIKWQKQLLPHVLKTEKCSFLLAVTHSPFIFNNELDKYAVSMNAFIN